jgi:hypothetical protein
VQYKAAIEQPIALTAGHAFTEWGSGTFLPEILIGPITFTGGTSVVTIGDELLMGFKEPEDERSAPRLSYRIFDSKNAEVFSIVDNEIRCHNDAFDIVTTASSWTVRSKLYKVDLIVRFDPPYRITIDRLHFKFKRWELDAQGYKFTLLFDGSPVILISGVAKVKGPCLFLLDVDNPSIVSKDMEVVFGAVSTPLGAISNESGYTINFPVYASFLKEKTRPETQMTFGGKEVPKTLPIYLTKSLAKKGLPADGVIFPLTNEELVNLVAELGQTDQIENVCINPTESPNYYASYAWKVFLRNIGVEFK